MKLFNIKYTILAVAVASLAVSCNDDDDITGGGVANTDFTGLFVQEDQMGRPGINTVFPIEEADENAFNTTVPSDGISRWQDTFEDTVDALYGAYGADYDDEPNILGINLEVTTTVLALDVLQVAPNAPTSYFNPNTGVPLTGRTLQDDVIDVSLILLFGGDDLNDLRFRGQDTDGDGNPDLPNLVSDNVGIEGSVTSSSFPYLVPASF